MKAIFFDLDGTLVDTLPLYVRSYKLALVEQGIHLSDKEIVEQCFGKTEDVICTNLKIPTKTMEFQKTYLEAVKSHFIEGKLFSGVLATLDLAKSKSLKLGIISFAYNWYVDGMVSGLNVSKYFDIVLGHNDVKNPKPDPEAVMVACERLSINSKETLVIGDSKSDIVMGNAAGTQTALFHPAGHNLFYELENLKSSNPTFIIGSFDELKSKID